MGVASAVACAEELEGELTKELARARGERHALKSLDTVKIEEHAQERRDFQERAETLQLRLRDLLHLAARELGIPEEGAEGVVSQLARAGSAGAQIAFAVKKIGALATTLSQVNTFNQLLAERALSVTRAYVRALSPRPAAYDRRGAESTYASAVGSVSRRA
jgi:hypothetical protein